MFAATRDGVSMSEASIMRRLAAILAADVVGYSRMIGEDEAGTLAALRSIWSEHLQSRRRSAIAAAS